MAQTKPPTPGEFIFGIASEHDVEGVRKALVEAPSLLHARDPMLGTTVLHAVAHRGYTDIVVMLLEAGADVHAREIASDTTPLHWAAEGGHVEIARVLVERGADVEARDE